jgi:hypothetical protein
MTGTSACLSQVSTDIGLMSPCGVAMSTDIGSLSAYGGGLSTPVESLPAYIGPPPACSRGMSTDSGAMPAYRGMMSACRGTTSTDIGSMSAYRRMASTDTQMSPAYIGPVSSDIGSLSAHTRPRPTEPPQAAGRGDQLTLSSCPSSRAWGECVSFAICGILEGKSRAGDIGACCKPTEEAFRRPEYRLPRCRWPSLRPWRTLLLQTESP